MSNIHTIVDRLGETYAEIGRLETKARHSAPSPFLAAQIFSLKNVAERLENEWQESAQSSFQEVYKYRVIGDIGQDYSVNALFSSLKSFQDLFSQVYGAISSGPKDTARIPPSIQKSSKLNIAYTFPGSFGFMLTSDSDRNLLKDTHSETLDAVFDIMGVSSEFDVRDLSSSLGHAVVKRVYDWAKANAANGFGIDLTQLSSEKEPRSGAASDDYFEELAETISATSDKTEDTLNVHGVLLGMDSMTKKFRFYDPANNQNISGVSDPNFDISTDWTINKKYVARINVISTTVYATMETKTVYRLLSLSTT